MVRLKKGIFFTFSAFFLVMLVVVLSLLVTKTLHQSNLRLSESGSLDRIYMLKVSLDRIISGIDDGITINLFWNDETNSTDLTISESINTNFANYGSSFYSDMQTLSNFVEADQPEINFDLSKVYGNSEKIPIIVDPNNFRYTHINENNDVLLRIYPGSYLSQVKLGVTQLNDVGSEIDWVTQNPGDDFVLNLTISDKNGDTTSETYLLNSTLVNTFRLNNKMDLTIGVLCAQCVELDRSNTNITTTFIATFPYSGEMLTVNYPQGLYLMNFSNLEILVNSTPRIL
ncbi:hypothetical protein J4438_01880 [Candidatus Woesearchaeota archaeon]|nr:hypothetical protein [Candidatus Woesearchaeota archaeon]